MGERALAERRDARLLMGLPCIWVREIRREKRGVSGGRVMFW